MIDEKEQIFFKSEKQKWFIASILFLFILIIIGLMAWGLFWLINLGK